MSCNISKCGFGSRSRRLRRRFGSSDMSTFQSYTGMPPAQMQEHLDGIPINLRSNFYTNLYGSRKRRGSRKFSKKLMSMPAFSPIKVSRRHRRASRRSRRSRRGSRMRSQIILPYELPVQKHRRAYDLTKFDIIERPPIVNRRRTRRFGKMNPSLSHIMGNTPANDMSSFQGYTGVAPMQMVDHLVDVPTSVRSNFYTDI